MTALKTETEAIVKDLGGQENFYKSSGLQDRSLILNVTWINVETEEESKWR